MLLKKFKRMEMDTRGKTDIIKQMDVLQVYQA